MTCDANERGLLGWSERASRLNSSAHQTSAREGGMAKCRSVPDALPARPRLRVAQTTKPQRVSRKNARCGPPWTDADLFDKLRRARQYGREPGRRSPANGGDPASHGRLERRQ